MKDKFWKLTIAATFILDVVSMFWLFLVFMSVPWTESLWRLDATRSLLLWVGWRGAVLIFVTDLQANAGMFSLLTRGKNGESVTVVNRIRIGSDG